MSEKNADVATEDSRNLADLATILEGGEFVLSQMMTVAGIGSVEVDICKV